VVGFCYGGDGPSGTVRRNVFDQFSMRMCGIKSDMPLLCFMQSNVT
jgi:hypothetical protein